MAAREDRFIPALRFDFLTRLYDPLVAATTRERTFKRRVLDRANLQDGESLLDLACGTGTLAIAAAEQVPRAAIRGIDGDPAILERARSKRAVADAQIEFDEGLSTDLPYDDASFDVVVSTLFFHHIGTDAKGITAKEICRVLRPGGRFVLGDWGRPQDPLMRAAFQSVRVFDGFETTAANVAGRIPEILRAAGFGAVDVTDRLRTPFGTIEIVTAAI